MRKLRRSLMQASDYVQKYKPEEDKQEDPPVNRAFRHVRREVSIHRQKDARQLARNNSKESKPQSYSRPRMIQINQMNLGSTNTISIYPEGHESFAASTQPNEMG